jgi:hypothetical protein
MVQACAIGDGDSQSGILSEAKERDAREPSGSMRQSIIPAPAAAWEYS